MSCKTEINMSASPAVHWRVWGNPFPTIQVGRIQFLMVIGLASLFPCWLSPQGHSASRSCPLDFSHGSLHLQSQQWCINSTSSYALKLCDFYLYLLLPPARESSLFLRTHVIRSGPPRYCIIPFLWSTLPYNTIMGVISHIHRY